MIQKLIDTALARLRDELATLISDPDDHIVVGPVATPELAALPLIVLAPGKIEISQATKETPAREPRPQPARQHIALTAANAGPYPLDHTPLQGTARGTLILDEDALTERREMMLEGQNFQIDYQQPALTLAQAPPSGSALLLTYSFAGLFTVREFQQALLIDVYDATWAAVEQWASLTTGALLTHLDELTTGATTQYLSQKTVTIIHTIDRIDLLGGTPLTPEGQPEIVRLQLTFTVAGRLHLIKELTDSVALIEQIHSPGKTPTDGVDIDVT